MRAFLTYSLIAAFVLVAFDADAARKRRKRSKRGPKGTITLVTATEGASVYLDGKLWGKTPLKPLKIAPSTYKVTVKKLGHLEFEQKIKVEKKKTVTVRAPLLPYAGVVSVSSPLSGAKVYVDGLERGPVPARFELKVGAHDVVVKAEGKEFRQELTAVAGEEVEVAATFETEDDAGLALAPLAPVVGSGAGAGGDELGLELVPPSAGDGEGAEDLSLVAPQEGNDDLDLVAPGDEAPKENENGELAIVPLDLPATATTSADPLNPASVSTQVRAAPRWYEEWWVWTAGGAVVVAAVATTVALSGGNEDSGPPPADRTFVTDGTDGVGPQLPTP